MARKYNRNIEVAESTEDIDSVEARTTTEKYKTEKCKVLSYNKKTKDLDVLFKECGIRLHNAENIKSDFVSVKYRGEIGKANFICKL